MKRTIPLFIASAAGLVLIVAYFIPVTQSWGETTSIWFDVLASIAMVLGGSGDYLAYALARQAEKVGASVMRIPSFLLKRERGSQDTPVRFGEPETKPKKRR